MSHSGLEAFAELAGQLSALARQTGFSEHPLRLGPLGLSLCIAPDCADLGFPVAFAGITTADDWVAQQDGTNAGIGAPTLALTPTFKIYIMRLRSPATEGGSGQVRGQVRGPGFGQALGSALGQALGQVLSTPTKTLQQLSNRQHTEQFVINDGERKTIRVFDQVNRIGLLAFADPMLLPPWEFFSPVKEFIHLHALNHDCLLFHGATLEPAAESAKGSGGATLMVGPGGSGKSTLTAYAIEHGMLTTGDDYVLVDLRNDTPRCHAVYRTLKLHPTSPVLQGDPSNQVWQAWRTDSFTGKSVMLAQTVANGGPLVTTTTLSSIVGLSLKPSSAVFNPKAQGIVSDPRRHPYLHSSMSTIQQMPYRIDATLQLSKKLHQAIGYRALAVAPGSQGLAQALASIQEGFV